MIVFVVGLPGSGKSFFAHHLANSMNAEYISSDRLRKKMFPVRSYSQEEKQKVYDEMLRQTMQLANKKDLVLDATFYKAALREKFLQAAEKVADVFFIEVWAEGSLIKERLQRTREDSEGDLQVYEKIKKEWEPLTEEHLMLQSTNNNIEEMLGKALRYLHFNHDKRTNQ